MRTFLLAMFVVALALGGSAPALAQDDLQSHPECAHCGMDRRMFAHSRMIITYADGSVAATCSLRCAAVDLDEKTDKTPKAILVADYGTKKLIDARTATWVLGGSQRGVMTRRAKWAFAEPEDAKAFVAEFGGQVVTFEWALQAAREDLR